MPVSPCFLSQATKRDVAKLNQDDVNMFWRYAKENGIFKGLTPEETRLHIADKFKLPERVVGWIMERNKTARVISDEARARQKVTARFLADNRRYLTSMDRSGIQKMFNWLNEKTRATTLYAHGPVPPVTHAIDVAITNPLQFVSMYMRGIRAISPKYTDAVMARLAKEPHYETAVKAGLPIAPEEVEGFHKSGWAGRAMDAALKPLRYKLWEGKWENVLRNSPEDATPDMAKHLAYQYAHGTGALVKGEPIEVGTRGMRKVALAPQLTPSKIAKSVFDPITTIKTFERTIESKIPGSGVKAPTPEERIIAYNRLRRSARWLAGTFGALAVNEALLKWSNSRQQVNYSDPTRGDWMAFKFAGHSYRMRGAMEIIGLIAKLGALGIQKPKFGQQTPEGALGQYGEYKLLPGIGIGKELLTGKDVFGRPVPWSKDVGTAKFPRKNVMEFVGEHGPIFMGHAVSAFHEALRNQGVDTRQSMNVIRAIMRNPAVAAKAAEEAALEGGAEFFGVNIQPDRYVSKPLHQKF